MFQMLLESLRGRALRWIVALATLLGVAGALGLHLSAAEATTSVVAQVLDLQRLTGYDILVRPAGARSDIQLAHGLLEPHHLLGIPGGITFDQYARIRELSGVEIAAPLANLGYYRQPLYIWLSQHEELGVYAVSCRTEEPFGPHTRREEQVTLRSAGAADTPEEQQALREAGIEPDLLPPVCVYAYAFSLTAIDPAQEAALFGLEGTVWGGYLSSDMLVERQAYQMASGQEVLYTVPALIRATQDISATFTSEIAPVGWPPEDRLRRMAPSVDAPDALARQEALVRQEAVASQILDAAAGYQTLLTGLVGRGGRRFNLPHFSRWARPSPAAYREHQGSPAELPAPVLEAEPVGAAGEAEGDGRVPVFRPAASERLESGLLFRFVGTYDPALLPYAPEAPLPPSVYALPSAVWTHDAAGRPIEPVPVHAGIEPGAYLQGPPTVLTIIEAARALGGEAPIGAVRVRVSGVEFLTPEGLARIREVAADIHRETGLDVDVVAGASPRQVTVHIPGYGGAPALGYIEETWTELGVGEAIHAEVGEVAGRLSGPLVGLYALLAAGGLPAFFAGRAEDLRLLLTLGWRRGAVLGYALFEALAGAAVAGVLGLGLAAALAARYDLGRLAERTWLVAPLAVGVCLLGGLAVAARVLAPRALATSRPSRRARPVWWTPTRGALLTLVVALAGAALVVFAQGAAFGLPARLRGTPLGEFIALHLRGPRDALLATTLAAAALGVTGAAVGRALTRRQEIGLLVMLGWRIETVVLRVALGDALAAGVGGLTGALAGGALAMRLYGLGIEALAGPAAFVVAAQLVAAAAAAAYPAFLATRASPADTARPD